MQVDVVDQLKSSPYFAISVDGSTNCSVVEKEFVYVSYVRPDGKTNCQFLCIKDVADATATGIKDMLEKAFTDLGLEDWSSKLVGMCVDGAAINLGILLCNQ